MKIKHQGAAIATLISSLTLVACGGGGVSGGTSAATTSSAQQPVSVVDGSASDKVVGVFIDSPVQGLTIKHSDGSLQKTGSWGQFTYTPGETIEIYLGVLKLASIKAKSTLTPLDLFGTADVSAAPVTNLLRLLQSLDEDGQPTNGITLSEAALQAAQGALQKLDLTQSIASFESSDDVRSILQAQNSSLQLVSVQDAQSHFQQSLSFKFRGLFKGTAKLADTGDVSVEGASSPIYLFSGRYTASNGKISSINLSQPSAQGDATLQIAGYQSVTTATGVSSLPQLVQDSGKVTINGDSVTFVGAKGNTLTLTRLASPVMRMTSTLFGYASQSSAAMCSNGTFTVTVPSGYGVNGGQYTGLVYAGSTGAKYAIVSTMAFGNAVFLTGDVSVSATSVQFSLPGGALQIPFFMSGGSIGGCDQNG